MSYEYAERAAYQQLGRLVIALITLLVAAFFLGRCSASYKVEVKTKEVTNGKAR